MNKIIYTLFSKTCTILFSLILGIIMFVLVAIYYPEQLEQVQIYASEFKLWLVDMLKMAGSTANVNVWIRQLLGDEQIVFLFFVIVARIALYLLFVCGFYCFIKPFKRKEVSQLTIETNQA